jgi:hypothetical protein
MWDIRFWILFAVILVTAGVVAAIKKLKFIDIQLMLMIAAFALSCDMIFCKQYSLYHYISTDYEGWYSYWANFFIVPAWGFLFIKFVPKGNTKAAVYIVMWTAASTLFELLVVKPLGIVQYHGWRIISYSTIGYFFFLIWIYVYNSILLKHCKSSSDDSEN